MVVVAAASAEAAEAAAAAAEVVVVVVVVVDDGGAPSTSSSSSSCCSRCSCKSSAVWQQHNNTMQDTHARQVLLFSLSQNCFTRLCNVMLALLRCGMMQLCSVGGTSPNGMYNETSIARVEAPKVCKRVEQHPVQDSKPTRKV